MSDRKVFTDSVIELPDQPGVTPGGMKVNARGAPQGDETMPITFALAPAVDDQQLEDLVAQGRTLTPDELRTQHGVPKADVDKLVAWLTQQGWRIDQVSDDGTSVHASATVAQIEKSLAVHMVSVTKAGITWNAARNAPSLPQDVGARVHAIIGLQPFRHAIKHLRRLVPLDRGGAAERAAPAPAKPAANTAPPYGIATILEAYNASGLGLTGKGQTIAILIDTVPNDADVQAFWTRNGIAVNAGRVTPINVTGGTLPGTEGEETLDVEWSSGIASEANVRVYASGSLQFTDLDRALDRIIADVATTPSMRQLSISLGLGETFMQKGELRTQHAKYLRLAALGVNVFVSSGDAGSNPDNTGHGSDGPLQPEYGASDTAVIGVGGTSLKLGSQGQVTSETCWPDSGGGRSTYFKRPAWQQGRNLPTGTTRMVPDVGLVADPNTGALIIFNGRAEQIGGTSWSAPVWAGFCALINEARANAGKPPLAFLGPQLYPLGGTEAFRDIVAGSNGAYHARTGYDMVTGLGVPDVKVLVQMLTR
jgi:kumamolisin